MRPGFHLGHKTLNFVIKILGGGIHGHAHGVVRGATQRFASPVRALIETGSDLYQSYGVNFVDSAGFGVVAHRRRIACDGQEVANASDAPGSQQRSLQTDKVLVPRGDMRDGFDAARLQSAGKHERVHAHTREGTAIDVNRVYAAAGRDLLNLLEDTFQRNAFRRIDLHRNSELARLELAPKTAFRIAVNGARSFRLRHNGDGSRLYGLRRLQAANRPGHGPDVLRRSAAATPDDTRSHSRRFAREKRELFRRGSGINGAITDARGKPHVGHGGKGALPSAESFEDRQDR